MNHIQHEVKNIWLDLVQNGSMIKRTIILRRITLYHIATAYLLTNILHYDNGNNHSLH